MIENVTSLKARLTQNGFAAHRICNRHTELVLEGYERSSNSFCSEMVRLLGERAGRRLKMVHHTHTRENVELARLMGRPLLVLVRSPHQAIASSAIYAERTVEAAARRWVNFYEWAYRWQGSAVFVDFDVVVNDFNRVVDALNRRFALDLPRSEDLAADTELVKSRMSARGEGRHSAERAPMKVGVPTPEREAVKRDLAPEVESYLMRNPEATLLYGLVRKLDDYVGPAAA